MAVGDITVSLLSFDKFRKEVHDPTPWNNHAKFSPADGRSVKGSRYAELHQVNPGDDVHVPDLRGLFLRGLNVFDLNTGVRHDDFADPDHDRQVASLQKDAFQGHGHEHEQGTGPDNPAGTFKGVNGNNHNQSGRVLQPAGIAPFGAPRTALETRPKNVAVYYYIQIN